MTSESMQIHINHNQQQRVCMRICEYVQCVQCVNTREYAEDFFITHSISFGYYYILYERDSNLELTCDICLGFFQHR